MDRNEVYKYFYKYRKIIGIKENYYYKNNQLRLD